MAHHMRRFIALEFPLQSCTRSFHSTSNRLKWQLIHDIVFLTKSIISLFVRIMHLGNQTQIINDVVNLMCDFPRLQRKENVQMKDAKSVFARSFVRSWSCFCSNSKKSLVRATMECPHYVLGMHTAHCPMNGIPMRTYEELCVWRRLESGNHATLIKNDNIATLAN